MFVLKNKSRIQQMQFHRHQEHPKPINMKPKSAIKSQPVVKQVVQSQPIEKPVVHVNSNNTSISVIHQEIKKKQPVNKLPLIQNPIIKEENKELVVAEPKQVMNIERIKQLHVQMTNKQKELKKKNENEKRKIKIKEKTGQQEEQKKRNLLILQEKNKREKEIADRIVAQNTKQRKEKQEREIKQMQNETKLKQLQKEGQLKNVTLSRKMFSKKFSA